MLHVRSKCKGGLQTHSRIHTFLLYLNYQFSNGFISYGQNLHVGIYVKNITPYFWMHVGYTPYAH